MNDKELQRKLDQLATLANELHDEAKRRFGDPGNLFFEAEGSFYMMAGDCDGSSAERRANIRFSSKFCNLGAGAW